MSNVLYTLLSGERLMLDFGDISSMRSVVKKGVTHLRIHFKSGGEDFLPVSEIDVEALFTAYKTYQSCTNLDRDLRFKFSHMVKVVKELDEARAVAYYANTRDVPLSFAKEHVSLIKTALEAGQIPVDPLVTGGAPDFPEILYAVQHESKIAAIKRYRALRPTDLREAKEAVEAMLGQMARGEQPTDPMTGL